MNTPASSVSEPRSTWRSKLQAIGPGVLMASAAVGGSHIIASTQAGAIYGWQLAMIVVLVNLFKYPFFRCGAQYTLDTGKSLLEGYQSKSPAYLWAFFVLNLFATVVNIAGVALITAAILSFMLPGIGINILAGGVLAVTLLVLLAGKYSALDGVSKLIMIALTASTVAAVAIAAANGGAPRAPDFIEASPWNMAALGFIIALMGWMPAPMEITAINSMWVTVKQKIAPSNYNDAMFDFNTGYVMSALLALVFLALGALVQYGNGEAVKMAGGQYIGQLIGMYAATIGDWSRLLVAFIAFACMFGTTLTVADGYGRINAEALRLLMRQKQRSNRAVGIWTCWSVFSGLAVILWFNSALGEMLRFAMISAFLTAPVFAWLNYSLVRSSHRHAVSPAMNALAIAGLIYLIGFALVFVLDLGGVWA